MIKTFCKLDNLRLKKQRKKQNQNHLIIKFLFKFFFIKGTPIQLNHFKAVII